jgi:hypothetical protein
LATLPLLKHIPTSAITSDANAQKLLATNHRENEAKAKLKRQGEEIPPARSVASIETRN